MRVNKKIVFLVFLPALLPTFFAFFFVVSQWKIKHDMKEKLESERLISLQINTADIVWVEEGREALINGKMFDVESYKQSGNQSVLTGLFDSMEDKLYEDLKQIMHEKKGQEKNLVKLFQWQLYNNQIKAYSFDCTTQYKKENDCYLMPFWTNCSSTIQKPPALV